MDTKDGAGDDAECPQSPGDEFGKIVTRDVFHHFAAAARERAIRERNGGADNQIAKSAKTQTECPARSEEHTSELQSHLNLVCRLLLEKKKNKTCPPCHASYVWPEPHWGSFTTYRRRWPLY